MDRWAQNRALKTWAELKRMVNALDALIPAVIIRGTFDSGIRFGVKESDLPEELQGEAISYADPTGEAGIAREVADRVTNGVETIAKNIGISLGLAEWILNGVPTTTDEAIRRAIPDCEACGRPVFGRVKSGFDLECYERKRTLRIADRAEFRRVRLAELNTQDETAGQ